MTQESDNTYDRIHEHDLPKAKFMLGEDYRVEQARLKIEEHRDQEMKNFLTYAELPWWYESWEEEMELRYSIDHLEERLANRPTMEERIAHVLWLREKPFEWADKKVAVDLVETKVTALGRALVSGLFDALKTLNSLCVKHERGVAKSPKIIRLCFNGQKRVVQVIADDKYQVQVSLGSCYEDTMVDVSVEFRILFNESKRHPGLVNIGSDVWEFSLRQPDNQLIIRDTYVNGYSAIKVFNVHETHLPIPEKSTVKQHKHYNLLQTIALRDCKNRPALGAAYRLDNDCYASSDGKVMAISWKIEEQGDIINFPKCIAKTGCEVTNNSFAKQLWEQRVVREDSPLDVRVYALDLKNALMRCIGKIVTISSPGQDELLIQGGGSQIEVSCYGYRSTDSEFSIRFDKKLLLEALKPFLKEDVISFQMHEKGPSIIGIEGDFQTLIMSLI